MQPIPLPIPLCSPSRVCPDILGTKIGYAFFAIAGGILRLNGAGRQLGWTGAGPWRSRRSGGRNDPRRPEGQLRVVPGKERSIAVGYFNVGSSIGAMIAPPLVVWAIVMHSWQMAFIISGVLSFGAIAGLSSTNTRATRKII